LGIFEVEKVVAKVRELVYNVWTTGDLQKSGRGVSRGLPK